MTHPLTLTSLPLFPLNTVLFPGGQLPLRVFELRYLDMVRKCHQAGSPFGVVALTAGDEVGHADQTVSFQSVGTLAQITQLDATQPDLLHVCCQGHARMHVDHKQLLHQGLWVADVTLIPMDQHVPVPDDLHPASQALAQVLHNLHQRQQAQENRLQQGPAIALPQPLQLSDCGWVANRWCELLPIPLALKQLLLELNSPLLRLELVSDVLERTGIVL